MTVNASGSWEGSRTNSSCDDSLISFNHSMETMYTYFYLLLFIPGLLLNTVALWVLCRHISKKTKAVIFMINLALADLAHILSLPLRIYYYFTHTWPFGPNICLICFYLKYLNMYAAIVFLVRVRYLNTYASVVFMVRVRYLDMYAAVVFLVCISVQRCAFLLNPFSARWWRRRYDLLISLIVWVVVGLACSPFIVMRSSNTNMPNPPLQDVQPTQQSLGTTKSWMQLSSTTSISRINDSSPVLDHTSCFKDLPIRKVSLPMLVIMMTLSELFGFVIPLACISISSIRTARSLKQSQTQPQQTGASLGSSARSRLQSVTSNGQPEKYPESQANSEKQRALRMVLSCSALFLFCFAPYHINFLFYMLVSQNYVSHCATRLAVKQFHPVSLCMASLSCCLNPLLYYFLTAEFRMHLKRTASFSSSLLSSPVNSPTECPARSKLLRLESTCSERD